MAIVGATVACVLMLAVPAFAAGGWKAAAGGTTGNLAGVAAPTAGLRWAVGAGGVIVASTDGGATWAAQASGVTQDLKAVAFADATHGWAVGSGGVILATADGGATWAPQTSGTTADLGGVAAADTTHAWAVGAGGVILATTDGATWKPQTSGTTADLSGVAAADTTHAWAVGAGGAIVATADGSAWTAQTSGTTQTLRAVTASDATHAVAVGAAGTILGTADGSAWTARTSGTTRDLLGVDYGDAAYIWASGAAGTVLRSVDGGGAWAAQTTGSSADLAAVAFVDPGRGAVAGAAGTILTTTSGGASDSAAPKTTATGLQTAATKGWRHVPQTVKLSATDAGSGVAATYYTVDGGARQTYTGPFDITSAASHVVKYWSADWAGNVEAKRTGYVNIDLSKPVCKALGNVIAYTGASAKFTFRVTDAKPTCGAGSVRISIQKNGQTKQKIIIARTTFNQTHSISATVKLAKGPYTWVVTATDLAGNVQKTKGHARLTMKEMALPTIADVQRRLIQLKYLPSGAVTGKADYRTSQALMAFQAWNGLSRDGVAGVTTRTKLAKASAPVPRSTGTGGHSVQVYRSKGVALCVDNGTLVRAVHCSTGRSGLETTAGTWSVYLKSTMFYSKEYSSWMPYASFFHNGEGLHGYEDVPAYPASHGCVRLPMPEAPWVYGFAYMGATVYVY
jgi:photosystem II stability/assembly factor-like uncharacterized protein/lipoprotein-anchoring transpeptidase ErfK/SrfK